MIFIHFLTSVYGVPEQEERSAFVYGKRTMLLTGGTEELAAFEINSNTFCSVLLVPDNGESVCLCCEPHSHVT